MGSIRFVLERLLSSFEDGRAVRLQVSRERGHASVLIGCPETASQLAVVSPTSFSYEPGREVLWLRYQLKDRRGQITRKVLVSYPETAETKALRADVMRINELLAGTRITLEGDPLSDARGPSPQLYRRFAASTPADIRFDSGGRLFGGWFQSLDKGRRADLRIDGEPIADLDFSSMFLRLAYLDAGMEPPEGDLYAGIRGLEDPRWREGVKRVAAALLFREDPMQRLPAGMKGCLPENMAGPEIRARLIERHPAAIFERGNGMRLMFRESEILMRALLTLADEGVAALPMHDGLMVATTKAGRARDAMSAASRSVVGVALPVVLKT